MSTDFTLDIHSDYIEIQHPADYQITPESQLRVWAAIGEACKKHHIRRVLTAAPVPPQRNMSTLDAFQSALQAVEAYHGFSMACCFPGYTTDETTEFFKTVAHNRGIRIEFFSNRQDALQWLGVEQGTQ